MKCPQCHRETPDDSKFCKECGYALADNGCQEQSLTGFVCERKQVTVLFSDLSGYTAMTERLDPEEVKAIMSDIFADITGIITKYEGHIERFIGDAVMAVFGMPIAHELDPVRALRATLEIHELVEKLSPQYEDTIGQPMNMHSGLNTGLVVTGEVDLEKGTHGITGDSVNTAARIQGLAKSNEILVGQETFRRAEGYFNFKAQPPSAVKNKSAPLYTYKVLSRKEVPDKVHRISGRRAQLVGREAEMGILTEAVKRLENGQGSVISICGEAGTGKSRLVIEFKASLDRKAIQWREGHAYGYTQNIPYYPLINLLSHAFRIEEGAPPSEIRDNVEAGIAYVMGDNTNIVPYIGSLFSIDYPEISQVSPEFWKSRLHAAIQSIVGRMSRTGPTVICIEDLHWADASFVELLHELVVTTVDRVLFVCVYRPTFQLFEDQIPDATAGFYHAIRLEALSADNTHRMLQSLLQADRIPEDLSNFVDQKSEGNPFYLEELINALIDSDILKNEANSWRLAHDLKETDVPTSIQGVLAARIDRLDKNNKRVLQEASVIGRAFLIKILKQVTKIKDSIDDYLFNLEQLDLIRVRAFDPDIEYIFKHALTQEVVYNGLLKNQRQEIHERIGVSLEVLFRHRLSELHEILAYHFSRSNNYEKAIGYLVKAGEKSLKMHSLDEANDYFSEAIKIYRSIPDRNRKNVNQFEIICKWAFVHDHMGDFGDLLTILQDSLEEVEKAEINNDIGMFYAWLGFAYYRNDNYDQAEKYLDKALSIGRSLNDDRTIGYALTWLVWVYGMRGKLSKALKFSDKAASIIHEYSEDRELFRSHVIGTGLAHFFCGNCKDTGAQSKTAIEYGKEHSDYRSLCMGFQLSGMERMIVGDYEGAIAKLNESIRVLSERAFNHSAKIFLGMAYVAAGKIEQAETVVKDVLSFSHATNLDYFQTPAQTLWSVILLSKGELSDGVKLVQELINKHKEKGSLYSLATQLLLVGRFYYYLASGEKKERSKIFKNISFLIKNYFISNQKAIEYLSRSIELSKEIGAKNLLGQGHYFMGLCHLLKKRKSSAEEHLKKSITIFSKTGAMVYLRNATSTLNCMSQN